MNFSFRSDGGETQNGEWSFRAGSSSGSLCYQSLELGARYTTVYLKRKEIVKENGAGDWWFSLSCWVGCCLEENEGGEGEKSGLGLWS